METEKILDSHIHLWPHSAASASGHSWMKPGAPLTRQFSIENYMAANKNEPSLEGFVYVETDRKLEKCHADDESFQWASETFREIRFLRRIVEGAPLEGEGFTKEQGALMKGAVIWAPVDHGLTLFKRYMQMAQSTAGEATWKRVKGIRFLLQGILDQTEFKRLALSDDFADILRYLPQIGGGLSFDVGVDTRSSGIWQLEIATEAVENLRTAGGTGKDTIFIMNHMCKPDYMHSPPHTAEEKTNFDRWASCIERLSKDSKVFMKLSGGFSEMKKQEASSPMSASDIVGVMRPWLDVLFRHFPAEKIMFGSDWPVCNVGGPGNEHSWISWKIAVEETMNDYNLTTEQKEQIWCGTAVKAYRL
jgi:L-rhamnono-1,4-lactonase